MKRKSKFKLEPVLKIRKLKEKQCLVEIGKLQNRIKELNQQKSEHEKGIGDSYKSQEDQLERGAEGLDLRFYSFFVTGKRTRIELIDKEILRLQIAVKDKYNDLNLLKADVDVIEKMKDKKMREIKKEIQKKEYAQIEEQVQNWKETIKKEL